MKMRLGFVSNSSTTSYIIGVPKHDLRGSLFAVFQKHYDELTSVLKPPYNDIPTLVDKLLIYFEHITHGWLHDREKWVWINDIKASFQESMEQNLTPFFIKLDIVNQQELSDIVHKLTNIMQKEIYIKQIKFP
jgi:hypothetical protein